MLAHGSPQAARVQLRCSASTSALAHSAIISLGEVIGAGVINMEQSPMTPADRVFVEAQIAAMRFASQRLGTEFPGSGGTVRPACERSAIHGVMMAITALPSGIDDQPLYLTLLPPRPGIGDGTAVQAYQSVIELLRDTARACAAPFAPNAPPSATVTAAARGCTVS